MIIATCGPDGAEWETGQNEILRDNRGVSPSGALDIFQEIFKRKTGLAWTDRLEPPIRRMYTYLKQRYEG
jgi:hypothetical protein